MAALKWEGVSAVEVPELEAEILTTRKNWRPWAEVVPFDASTLNQDLERIRRFYRRRGFFETEVQAEAQPKGKDAVVVVFQVTEGPEVRLAALRLEAASPGSAASPVDPAAIRSELGLAPGDRFGSDAYRSAKEALLAALAKRGYPTASVAGGADVRLEDHEAEIAWTVTPGPFVRLGPAELQGLEKVAPELVEREITWQPGAPYDPAELRSTQRAIYGLGLFRSVAVIPLRPKLPTGSEGSAEQEWPMEIRIEERSPQKFRLGVGYGTEDRFRAIAEWKHRNFLGGLRSARITGKYSFLETGVATVLVQPRFLDAETALTLDWGWSQETAPAFDARGVSTGWLLERPLWPRWTGRVGQRFELKRVTEVEADTSETGIDDNEQFRLVLFNLGARRSTLDKRSNPRSGTWLDLSLEPSFKAVGSDVDYLKAAVEGRVFVPLPKTLVLASRLRLGTLEPLTGTSDPEVPIFKRLFAGGSTSVRGFPLDELGPLDDDGEPIGGLTAVEASVELRFPIWKALRGVAFTDAGQVALESFTLRGSDVFYSAGVGLRYDTPIGPLRVDFARILNPPSEVSPFRVHFSIGHAF